MTAELVLNVFEHDRYWIIARRLDEIAPDDLTRLAEGLREWGLGDVAEVASRAKQRLDFLAHFERLIASVDTPEYPDIHKVIETAPWIVGDEFETWVSNRTLRRNLGDFADKKYRESNGSKRPDLILVASEERYLLIELKRPSWELCWDDVAQVKEYRDSLHANFPNATFAVRLLGGTAKPHMAREEGQALRVSTYTELIEAARRRLRWLLDNLDAEIMEAAKPAQEGLGILTTT